MSTTINREISISSESVNIDILPPTKNNPQICSTNQKCNLNIFIESTKNIQNYTNLKWISLKFYENLKIIIQILTKYKKLTEFRKIYLQCESFILLNKNFSTSTLYEQLIRIIIQS